MVAKKVTDAGISYPSRNLIKFRFKTEMGWHEYLVSPALAANISIDLTSSGLPSYSGEPTAVSADGPSVVGSDGEVFPDTLTLPLVTEPIRIGQMTDHPDGFALELRMVLDTPDGEFQRVRLPMFSNTAKEMVKALTAALHLLEEGSSKLGQA